jgi:hypothetical protein
LGKVSVMIIRALVGGGRQFISSSPTYVLRRPMSMLAGIAKPVGRSTFAANERTLASTETPAQGGRAFNSTHSADRSPSGSPLHAPNHVGRKELP